MLPNAFAVVKHGASWGKKTGSRTLVTSLVSGIKQESSKLLQAPEECVAVDAENWKRSLYCFDFYCLAGVNLLTYDNLTLRLIVFMSLLFDSLTQSGLLLFSDSHVT